MDDIMNAPSTETINAHIDGHDLVITTDGQARLNQLIGAINSARHSLRLFYYIFTDGMAGQAVREALLRARERGVSVSILIDGFGSADLNDGFFGTLLAAGASFARFHSRFGRRYLLRNHQKMLIIDEYTAIIGGANIADDYFTEPARGSQWHDLSLSITGPKVAAGLASYFDDLSNWVHNEGSGIRSLQRVLVAHSESSGPICWLHGGPFQRHSPFTARLRADLEAASSVDMIQAYFSPNWSFLRRLWRIARRGRVRVVTAARSDNATTIGAARHCYPALLKRHAQLYEYGLSKLHMKLIVIDDVTYIGSANFDTRSLYINVELMLRIEDMGFASQMRQFCVGHHAQSQAISQDYLKRIAGPFRRLRWLLAYFLVSTVDYTITRRLNIQ